ncbi:ATP-dependent DNA helicase DDX11 isoform X2 [Rhodnius prolixus]|uniref:ATP-dependent DNA helicase DDX11 isoform X2 n=1 Tax=Rhodnius prolixus TaxID=13249 RepID=UPI003D189F56
MERKEFDEYKLTTPKDFSFPFPPYEIQLDFMKKLYTTIEDKNIGIFESPTGTGKSLSIICGALTWLTNHEEREVKNLEVALEKLEPSQKQSTHDWLSAQIKERENKALMRQLKQKLDRIHIRNESIKKIRDHSKEKTKKWNASNVSTSLSDENENEENVNKNSDELDDLLEEFLDYLEDPDADLEESDKEEEEQPVTRVIYCSRTHSQLSQFISEIQKTKFSDDIRIVHLASRQNYCINKKLQNVMNVAAINEKCLEMQQGKEYKTTLQDKVGASVKRLKSGNAIKCLHMKGIDEFSKVILSQVMDVEAVAKGGRKIGSCPYYATRSSIPLSQVIVIPYHTLLHKGSRDASGLCLDNSVVIIDEAHNLLETLSHIHSSQINGQQLTVTHSQLCQYRDRFLTKFSATNLLFLNQLIFVISALMKLIKNRSDNSTEPNVQLLKVAEFIMTAEIDNYNLYKLLAFCKQSKIAHKLQRFSDKADSFVKIDQNVKTSSETRIKEFIQGIKNKKTSLKKTKQTQNQVATEQTNTVDEPEEQISQPLFQVTAFLSCLTQEYNDGRVVVSREMTIGKSIIKYLLLEPASVVTDIVNKARSVILAGGTMEPVSEFKERLFNVCGVPTSRIIHFSCGHVIPKENILPVIVCTGPTGKQLDFSYSSRSSTLMLNEIGRLLINVCNVVPSGVVCFFPSYEYVKEVYEFLEKNGVIKSISVKKKIFREPKKSSEVEKVLADFSLQIENAQKIGKNTGALLLSVVGGKLSEGLNFSDDLGRCVIVIGMPYPNMRSPELQEKMKYLEERWGSNASKVHYENLCMKAVNQSVGRSIRHRNDYSSVLLVDQRYSRPNIYKLLPKWMHESLRIEREKFGPVLGQLSKFFKLHASSK